jgi:hypothetical protein
MIGEFMAKHKGAYNMEKRQKEQKRLKKQEEKRQKRDDRPNSDLPFPDENAENGPDDSGHEKREDSPENAPMAE